MSQGCVLCYLITRLFNIAKNTAGLATLTQEDQPSGNMRLVLDKLNDGSKVELICILMQVQIKMYHDTGRHLGKLVSSVSL